MAQAVEKKMKCYGIYYSARCCKGRKTEDGNANRGKNGAEDSYTQPFNVIQCVTYLREGHMRENNAKVRKRIVQQRNIEAPMMLRGFLAKGWLETLEEAGVPSPDRKN